MANEFDLPMPSWVKAPDPGDIGRLYAEGVSIGARIASERARLAEASAQNNQELALQAQQIGLRHQAEMQAIDQRQREAEQQAAIDKAYKDAQIGIRDAELQQAQEKVRLETEKQARLWAAQQNIGRAVRGGMDIEKAIFENPEMLSPGLMTAIVRGRGSEKQYGEPVIIPGPGGSSLVYRQGSPGVHVVQGPKPEFTPYQIMQLRKDRTSMKRELAEAVPGSPEHQAISEELKQVEAELKRQDELKKSRSETPRVPVPPPSVRTNAPTTGTAAPRTLDTFGTPYPPASGRKKLTREAAMKFWDDAGGDRKKAEQLAKDAGYEF